MKSRSPKQNICLRLPVSTINQLHALSDYTGVSMSGIVSGLIGKYFKEHEAEKTFIYSLMDNPSYIDLLITEGES